MVADATSGSNLANFMSFDIMSTFKTSSSSTIQSRPCFGKSRYSIGPRFRTVPYDLYTIWLFTLSDLKTIVGPSTAFALLHTLSGPSFEIQVQYRSLLASFGRIFIVAAWVWINLLPFTIDNQRQENGIEEDRYNKPWRPLPSGRMTAQTATRIMVLTYPVAIAASIYLGAHAQSLTLLFLGIFYNDFRGADMSWLVRNLINGVGYVCYTSGAFQVMLGMPITFTSTLRGWFLSIGCVIFTTVQIQDLYDQAGDDQRGRKTAPLVLGDRLARWTVALPLLFWSCFCPYFWLLPAVGFVVPSLLGLIITYRLFAHRTVEADHTTFRLWNVWLVVVFSLPWMRTLLL